MSLFNKAVAIQYDTHIRTVVPAYEAFTALTQAYCLSQCADGARILVVGAGTGYELAALCNINPTWQFIALEPSSDMLSKAKQRCQSYNQQISWHLGTLADIPAISNIDMTVCLLVLHFLEESEKHATLQAIAQCTNTQGSALVAQRIQVENPKIAQLELAHAQCLGLSIEALALMRERLAVMNISTQFQLHNLYQKTGWKNITCLAQVLNYQLDALTKD